MVCAFEIYEVYKVIRRDISAERAVEAVSTLRRATIAPVDADRREHREVALPKVAEHQLERHDSRGAL